MSTGNNKLIAKNTIILAMQQVFTLVVSLYSSRLILQALGVVDFGIYNVVGGFVAMFAFLNTSMSNATQRFYNYEYGKNGEPGALNVFNTAIIIQGILALALLLLLESFGLWYLYDKLVVPDDRFNAAVWIFQFSTISLVFVVMQIPFEAAILAHEKMSCLAVVSVIDTTLKLLIALSIKYINGDQLIWYGLLFLFISILNFLIYFFYSRKHFKEIRFKFIRNKEMFRQMLSFSGWNLFGSFAGVAKEQGVNVVLNLFFGPVVNAARGIAYQITGALKSFTTNITIAGRPQLVQSYAQNNIDRTIQLMFSMSKLSYLVVALFSIPVFWEVDYILELWLATEIPSNTGVFVRLVIWISLVESLNPPVSFVVHATGKMRRYQIVTSLLTVMILPLSYIGLLLGGAPEIVFYLGIICQIVVQIACLLILKSLIQYSLFKYIKEVLLPILIVTIFTLLASFSIYLFMGVGVIRLGLICIVSALVMTISSYYIVLNDSEKCLVNSLLFKI